MLYAVGDRDDAGSYRCEACGRSVVLDAETLLVAAIRESGGGETAVACWTCWKREHGTEETTCQPNASTHESSRGRRSAG